MADFLTHILFSDMVFESIESRRIAEGVIKNRSLYHLGAQGPDPWFFYNCFPGSGKGELKELGNTMHVKNTGAFLKGGFDQLKDVSWSDDWLTLAVYLSGFVCHFALDSTIHPYVYWACQHWIWTREGTPATASHQEVEIALDILFWKMIKGASASKIRTRKLVDIGKSWPPAVSRFLTAGIESNYGIQTNSKGLNKVLKDFYRGHDFLYDPKGWKKQLVNWLDSLTGGGIKPEKMPYPIQPDPRIDWGNEKKRTWFNPFLEGEEYQDSVEELMQKAAFKAANIINSVFMRIFNNQDFEELFPDISYDTGIECT